MSRCCKIILFYLIFYAALVSFFAAMLAVFYHTLDPKKPKRLLDDSLINPGLGFRPLHPHSNVESTLIWYKSKDKGNVEYWQNQLKEFVNAYSISYNLYAKNVQECEYGVKPSSGKVCNFDFTNAAAPCTINHGYNSSTGGPCIFLKLNKIYGWIPDYYDNTNLPDNMPEDLKAQVRYAEGTDIEKTVWVSCEGENPSDLENIGPIQYKPIRGFPGQYFPFENTAGYLSPAVAVYFENPTRGVLINVECKAWARNIQHDRVGKQGSVHFELLVD